MEQHAAYHPPQRFSRSLAKLRSRQPLMRKETIRLSHVLMIDFTCSLASFFFVSSIYIRISRLLTPATDTWRVLIYYLVEVLGWGAYLVGFSSQGKKLITTVFLFTPPCSLVAPSIWAEPILRPSRYVEQKRLKCNVSHPSSLRLVNIY